MMPHVMNSGRSRTAPMLARSALRDKAKRALSVQQAERLRDLRDKLTR